MLQRHIATKFGGTLRLKKDPILFIHSYTWRITKPCGAVEHFHIFAVLILLHLINVFQDGIL